MSQDRAYSSPELLPSFNPDDSNFEGLTANVTLLLKLIHDCNNASNKDDTSRKTQRAAAMIGILDDLKTRIEKCHSPRKKGPREAELRRCNTDLRRTQLPSKEKKPQEPTHEENQRLRKELSASLTARKSLERMFSSLGKEKEIMAAELSRKVQEVSGMEEHINDLKAQNEKLLEKVQFCAAEHKEIRKTNSVGDTSTQKSVALQEQNRALSDQLLKSLEGYRSLKRKLKDSREENARIHAKMAEIREEISEGLIRIHDLRRRITGRDDMSVEIEEELSAVERMFRCFDEKVSIIGTDMSDCGKTKADVVAENPSSVVA